MKHKLSIILAVGTIVLLSGCIRVERQASPVNTAESNQTTSTENQENSPTSQSTQNDADAQVQHAEIKLTVDDAIKKYQESYPQSEITQIKLDKSYGSYVYRVEGVDNDKEYKIRMSASDGKVDKEQVENLDQDERNGNKRTNDALDLANLLPLAEISKAAVAAVGEGVAEEWSLEKELSTVYWEVKVRSNHQDSDVKINAQDAKVLEVDKD